MQGFERDGNTIDTASIQRDWLSSMSNIVVENSLLSTKSCIFVTPKVLFKNNKKAYVPTAFSIGPLHHGKRDFKEAEKIKLKYTQDLISRVKEWNQTIVQDLVDDIADLEKEARECYSVPVEPRRDKFIKILLVDGCFLIELFRKGNRDWPHSVENDPVFSRAFLREVLDTDLLLLENQIPWIVLDRLFSRTTPPRTTPSRTTPPRTDPLTQLAWDYISYITTGSPKKKQNIPRTLGSREHLLDLLRSSFIGSTMTQGGDLDEWELIPSASSLIEAGVKFKKPSTDRGILDIKFSNGTLEIPPFTIHESTESLFRNMISFEQCYDWCEPRITCYAMLLDILINTPKDMDILVRKGIIRNWLNPEEATQIFNRLYYDACVSEFYYLDLCKEVNKYCKLRWPRWRAIYVRNHFSSPWAIASQVFAAIIFVVALLQTVFSIKK